MEQITLNINGEDHIIWVSPKWTLLRVLRKELGMTGTKCGCDSVSCGACKVVIDDEAMNSCAVLAVKATGKKIETIEGMSTNGVLHPIQQAFIDCGAVQCGYCTPGMVMSAKALLAKNPNPTEDEVRGAIGQNLCRCTGYVKIVDSIMEAARRMNAIDCLHKEAANG